jgi:hypothetical protein
MMDYSMGSAAGVDNPVGTRGAQTTTVVVAFLAHAECQDSGEIYTVPAGPAEEMADLCQAIIAGRSALH